MTAATDTRCMVCTPLDDIQVDMRPLTLSLRAWLVGLTSLTPNAPSPCPGVAGAAHCPYRSRHA